MTETGSPRCRTCSPREARRRGCCCAKVSPMNGGPGSMAPDRHTPRRTLPDSCSTAARAVSWSTTSCAAIVQTFQRSPQYRRRNAARGAGVITVPHLSMHAGLLRRDSTHVPGSGRRRPPSVRTHHSPELRLSPLAALCETDPVDIRPRRRILVPERTSARQSRSPSHPRAHSTPPGGAGPAERNRHGRSRALHWPGWRRARPVTTGHNSRCGWRRRTCHRASARRGAFRAGRRACFAPWSGDRATCGAFWNVSRRPWYRPRRRRHLHGATRASAHRGGLASPGCQGTRVCE